ncbi:MAG TPA: hypothetical protein VFX29_04080 [Longimicrobiaceae bacterium]|nr:hypothetical protein [Longimicrobiaceae bacterium]
MTTRAALRGTPLLATTLAVLTLAACGERGAPRAGTSAETALRARHPEAARAACITHTLAQQAVDDLATLEEVVGATGAESSEVARAVQARAGRAAYDFARAYLQLALLHEGAAAYADSAANHSATPADSTRYAARAAGFEISVPEPGTLEANITDTYTRRYAEIRSDPDHPCNWNI